MTTREAVIETVTLASQKIIEKVKPFLQTGEELRGFGDTEGIHIEVICKDGIPTVELVNLIIAARNDTAMIPLTVTTPKGYKLNA